MALQLYNDKALIVGGKAAVNSSCCCVTCENVAPSVNITISGFSFDGSCISELALYCSIRLTAIGINGVYSALFSGSEWDYEDHGPQLSYNFYKFTGCVDGDGNPIASGVNNYNDFLLVLTCGYNSSLGPDIYFQLVMYVQAAFTGTVDGIFVSNTYVQSFAGYAPIKNGAIMSMENTGYSLSTNINNGSVVISW